MSHFITILCWVSIFAVLVVIISRLAYVIVNSDHNHDLIKKDEATS